MNFNGVFLEKSLFALNVFCYSIFKEEKEEKEKFHFQNSYKTCGKARLIQVNRINGSVKTGLD